ncbi:MAG: type I-E CRISPR-associated protein Cas7/Cse4/CasC [Thermodesulfobacteriota bacterium]
MLIEIHMIQNHSPANLNRDDRGAPKTCIFGGVPRARISSQCLKRSIRKPANPDDIHNRGAGIFAAALAGHIGCRTKFFPDLVKDELKKSKIPEEEHDRIVLKATRIATSKEKEVKAAREEKADPRPKTAQIIHLGPGHAKYFVVKLEELRKSHKKSYEYFLNPEVGFQEMVRDFLEDSGLKSEDQKKIVHSSWVIAKCRRAKLLEPTEGEGAEPEPESEDRQPNAEDAKLIAERLAEFYLSDNDLFKELTKGAKKEEKNQIKEKEPPKPDKKELDDFKAKLQSANRLYAVDIALFGRMTTSEAFQDVEAAMQVAHAISTHAVVNEVDYFTAVDDLGKTGGGAGHVGEIQYNSACFYKYFSLDWDQFIFNLAGKEPKEKGTDVHKEWVQKFKPKAEKLAAATLGHFIRAAAMDTPSGKQNSFASHCEPCGILVEIKKNTKTPTNFANAFAEPVERIGKPDDNAADEKSIEGRSVACLADHVQAIRHAYGINSTLLWYSPKLWRYPFRYWERSQENGKKLTAHPVTELRFEILGGEEGKPTGLVEALVKEMGFDWAQIQDIGKAPATEV